MKDNRKYARRHISEYLMVKDLASGQLLGRVANLSPKGLMIIGNDPLAIGTPLRLVLKLPNASHGKDHLALTAECRWNVFKKQTEIWEIGMYLLEMVDDERRILQQIVLQLMAESSGKLDSVGVRTGQSIEKIEYVPVRRYRK